MPEDENAILFGYVGPLVEQKGINLLLEIIPALVEQPRIQLVALGEGDPEIKRALQDAAARFSDRIAVNIGYDESLAHRIQGGCDSFLMPSVVDANAQTLLDGTATGFVFEEPTAGALREAVARLIDFRQRPGIWWEKLAVTGMSQDFAWATSALLYSRLYHQTVNNPAQSPLA